MYFMFRSFFNLLCCSGTKSYLFRNPHWELRSLFSSASVAAWNSSDTLAGRRPPRAIGGQADRPLFSAAAAATFPFDSFTFSFSLSVRTSTSFFCALLPFSSLSRRPRSPLLHPSLGTVTVHLLNPFEIQFVPP